MTGVNAQRFTTYTVNFLSHVQDKRMPTTPEIYDHALLADEKLATHVNDLLEACTINERCAGAE